MKFIYPAVFRKTENGTYHGFFPDLECCYADGDTLDDAIDNANEAAYNWISLELSEDDCNLPSVSDKEDMELQEGRIVRLGDFGSFRISVSSDGVTDKKDFNSSMLRPLRIIFTPGGELKDTKKTLEYSRISQDGTTAEAGGSDSDSLSEI
mgnify:FL=1